MQNILIEKNENGCFKQYGKSPIICIKAHLIYEDSEKDCFIPVACDRYGNVNDYDSILTEADLENRIDFQEYLKDVYERLTPSNIEIWKKEIEERYNRNTEKHKLLRCLLSSLNERVLNTDALPGNSNPQKSLQALREDGLVIITERENRHTYLRLVEGLYLSGFKSENIPEQTRKKVLKLLGYIDALSGNKKTARELVVEHKFPESRWGNKTVYNNIDMSDDEIKEKFQLLTNQYNIVKREACKKCYAYGERQAPFGITYFYQGDENWNCDAIEGDDAEKGCIGCGWYDTELWKKSLIEAANKEK